jgi:hypothetical protein
MGRIATALGTRIILDESLLRSVQLDALAGSAVRPSEIAVSEQPAR